MSAKVIPVRMEGPALMNALGTDVSVRSTTRASTVRKVRA